MKSQKKNEISKKMKSKKKNENKIFFRIQKFENSMSVSDNVIL